MNVEIEPTSAAKIQNHSLRKKNSPGLFIPGHSLAKIRRESCSS